MQLGYFTYPLEAADRATPLAAARCRVLTFGSVGALALLATTDELGSIYDDTAVRAVVADGAVGVELTHERAGCASVWVAARVVVPFQVLASWC